MWQERKLMIEIKTWALNRSKQIGENSDDVEDETSTWKESRRWRRNENSVSCPSFELLKVKRTRKYFLAWFLPQSSPVERLSVHSKRFNGSEYFSWAVGKKQSKYILFHLRSRSKKGNKQSSHKSLQFYLLFSLFWLCGCLQ